MTHIMIANDFSRFPAGRFHPQDGNATGERFRAEFLVPALEGSGEKIRIFLDGTTGYPSSFLEEAFAGLVKLGYAPKVLRERLEFVTADRARQHYIDEIWDYVEDPDLAAMG